MRKIGSSKLVRQAPKPKRVRPATQPSAANHARLSTRAVQRIFDLLAQQNPDPRTELRYENPFQLLAAVMLSAQTTDRAVNKATPALFAAAPTPQAIVELGVSGVLAHIRRIGLAPTKARNLVASSALLLERHQGAVPSSAAALEALPGVGRKTANVVRMEAFGEETIAVDTHVFRVSNRTGLAPGRTPLEVETLLQRVVPPQQRRGAHHWLILHGRYVCQARKPRCAACVIRAECVYPEKTELASPNIAIPMRSLR